MPASASAARSTEARTSSDSAGDRDPLAAKLIDFISREEYLGESDLDLKPGHIPGAVNIVWRELVAPDEVLAPAERIRSLLASSGVRPSDPIVSYCRMGLRAAIGYLALEQLGYQVRLYDASYLDWVRRGLPVDCG